MKRYNHFDQHWLLIGIIIPFLIFFISLNVTYAYFTATASKKEVSSTTGIVRIVLKDHVEKVNSVAVTENTKLLPGDNLAVSATVENSGNSNVYVIIEFKVEVTKQGETDVETVMLKRYSFSGSTITEIKLIDGEFSAKAFLLEAPNEGKTNTFTKSFNVDCDFDATRYDNSYQNASVNYSVCAYSIQTENLVGSSSDVAVNATEILLDFCSNPNIN